MGITGLGGARQGWAVRVSVAGHSWVGLGGARLGCKGLDGARRYWVELGSTERG